jgi:hypothetical protein
MDFEMTSVNRSAQKVIDACTHQYDLWKNDCNYFLRNVAREVGFAELDVGNADAIVDFLENHWITIEIDEARNFARQGYFVVAGLKSGDHTPPRANGHVAIVVDSNWLYQGKYPYAWCGSIGTAQSHGDKSVGEIWNKADRDHLGFWRSARMVYWRSPGW